jgi:hypothetical protein
MKKIDSVLIAIMPVGNQRYYSRKCTRGNPENAFHNRKSFAYKHTYVFPTDELLESIPLDTEFFLFEFGLHPQQFPLRFEFTQRVYIIIFVIRYTHINRR